MNEWLAQVGAQAAIQPRANQPDPLDLLEAAGLIAHRATHPHGPVDPEWLAKVQELASKVKPGPSVEEILHEMRESR